MIGLEVRLGKKEETEFKKQNVQIEEKLNKVLKMNYAIKRELTLEEMKSGDFPDCNNCRHYHNLRSSIFGDAWGCSKDVKHSFEVSENRWSVAMAGNTTIVDCGYFEEGQPQTFTLG